MVKPVSYIQWDSRWKNIPYATQGEKSTIGSAGCGPTSAAMILSTVLGQTITPIDTSIWSLKNGYKAYKQGTYYSYFKAQGAAYGLKWYQMNSTNIYGKTDSSYHDKAKKELEKGNYIIALMGKGHWTSSGHFIVWYGYEDGICYINDPNSTKESRVKGDWDIFSREVKYYFVCETPQKQIEPWILDKYKVVSEDGVNMRSGPGLGYDLITCIPKGKIVDLLSQKDGWGYVKYKGLTGYTSMRLISKYEPELKDIKGHWAEDIIKYLQRNQIVVGNPDETFKPDNKVTRAEMAHMVYSMIVNIKGGHTKW